MKRSRGSDASLANLYEDDHCNRHHPERLYTNNYVWTKNIQEQANARLAELSTPKAASAINAKRNSARINSTAGTSNKLTTASPGRKASHREETVLAVDTTKDYSRASIYSNPYKQILNNTIQIIEADSESSPGLDKHSGR